MIYNIHDKLPFKQLLLYGLQVLLSCFVATVLISSICGTPTSSCLVAAGIGTLLYLTITGFGSPMFISSSGGLVSAVVGALALGDAVEQNFTAVFIGGIAVFCVYLILAIIAKKCGYETINKFFPPVIVGSATMVIGLNLATFIPTYCNIGGEYNVLGVIIALVVMLVVAIVSHYAKGFLTTIPFLIALGVGYIIAVVLTVINVYPLIDFSIFANMKMFEVPDFAFFHIDFINFDWSLIWQILVLFVPVCLATFLEAISDHKCLSVVTDTDLFQTVGLHKILIGDGLANMVGTFTGGLCQTSYGENVGAISFSRVASTSVTATAAIMMIFLGFFTPVQRFIASIPAFCLGGCSMILYGMIFASGLKTLMNNHIDMNDNRNLIIISAMLTIGVGGIIFNAGVVNLSGVALCVIIGIILNFVLKKRDDINV